MRLGLAWFSYVGNWAWRFGESQKVSRCLFAESKYPESALHDNRRRQANERAVYPHDSRTGKRFGAGLKFDSHFASV